MKKSVGICCFYGNSSIEEKSALAKEAGFKGIEIDPSEEGPQVDMKSLLGHNDVVYPVSYTHLTLPTIYSV